MGIYQYTLRSDTKRTADGIEVGHYLFAYKHGWDWHPGRTRGYEGRVIAAKERAAENAAHKLRRVKHVVVGDWKHASTEEGMNVYLMRDGPYDQFTEELRTTPIVGILRKVRNRYVIGLPPAWAAAYNERISA